MEICPRRTKVEKGGNRADGIRESQKDALKGATDAETLASEDGVDHDCRKKPEGAKSHRGDIRKRTFDTDLRQFVQRERAEIPDQTENGREKQQRIESPSDTRRLVEAHHHREQHRVQHDAGAQPDKIQEFADIQGG